MTLPMSVSLLVEPVISPGFDAFVSVGGGSPLDAGKLKGKDPLEQSDTVMAELRNAFSKSGSFGL